MGRCLDWRWLFFHCCFLGCAVLKGHHGLGPDDSWANIRRSLSDSRSRLYRTGHKVALASFAILKLQNQAALSLSPSPQTGLVHKVLLVRPFARHHGLIAER